jgi:glycosyltransferase involved in cell wall biosynthesis
LGGVESERSLLLPVGIDTERFHTAPQGLSLRKEWETESGAILVGCVGSISHLKGQDILVEAILPVLERDRRVRLVFVGSGPDRLLRELKSKTHTFVESGQVRFEGWHEDIPAAFAALDIVVVPSRAESFSRVAAEAMAMGKPVVASRTGAVEELFDHDRCGLSVPVGDTSALREALIRILADVDLRQRLGQDAMERIRESFSLHESQKTFRKIVRFLCGASENSASVHDEIK